MTGGDTARAMLEALGIDALTIEGELEPGLSVSAPIEGRDLRAVLKAGGFGDNGVFLRVHP
jgi:4-hydroxythreonine-4-phosphate dehydrogenase